MAGPFWQDKNAGVIEPKAPEPKKASFPAPKPSAPPAPAGGGGDEAPELKEIWHALEDLNARVTALESGDAGEDEIPMAPPPIVGRP